ncbi:hypothetical protein B9T25_12925 [Acinetobacter sp. ANC 4470]|uniref:phage tail-collar fiber domain-containing protein n=1 Tax=Acinetobacter sp. ANC 4470 TaxID=1977881 RepID=UPI000A3347E2|nr:phage tail protein [Acinetobacter sp. ANC 4470]OTG64337.1 hypothetical protein B9T25_12925 [Acinetobacter sp. ANC 4470]
MADYYNVTTNTGDAEIAAAIASNTKLAITHIAFGDGNGAVPTPSKTRTTLVREVHRQEVTKYERHPTNANWIVIETIIPSNIGGFWVREMGIIANGKLISHGSHAPFEKVADPTGVSEYRLKFTQNVRDGNVVEISLDESLIYASQAWVDENYIRRNELVDNLTTNDATKPLSAKQAKVLQDNKLDKIANSVGLQILEDRTLKPTELSQAVQAFFGTYNSDNGVNFCDFLTINGWSEPSGGGKNALVFHKQAHAIYHFQADYNDETWTRKKQLAYTDSNITGNANTATQLKTPRLINGVSFDGSVNITIQPKAKVVPEDADLNDYQSEGFFECNSYAVAPTIANNISGMPFSLLVERGAGIKQTLSEYMTSSTWVRWCRDSGSLWTAWTKIAGAGTAVTYAEKLKTPRQINGVNFDATQDISIEAPLRTLETITTVEQLALAVLDGKYAVVELGIAGLWGYGFLVVLRSGGVCHQVYYPHEALGVNNATMAMRQTQNMNGNSATWSEWRVIGTRDDSKLPLSGGTLTGPLVTKELTVSATLGDLGTGSTAAIRTPTLNVGASFGYVPFMHGSVQSSRGFRTNVSLGIYRPEDDWNNSGGYIAVGGLDASPTEAFLFLNGRKITNTAGAIELAGNAATATKLQTARKIFGQTFDGANDVGGTITVSDGIIKSDEHHYIDLGRYAIDRINFSVPGAIFNFMSSSSGEIVARITSNGIDCNAATASKLATARKINGIDFDGTTDIEVIDDALQYMPITYPKSTPPTGYLAMMGQAISQSVYPKLYTLYGPSLPDLRAYSIRGLDYGRGIDTDRIILSEQQDDIKSHTHTYFRDNIGGWYASAGGSGGGEDLNTSATGGAETRVKNIAFLYIVKAG